MCWSLVVTPMENINLQIDVYLNLRLLENFRLSLLRFVSQNRSGVCLALGFGLFNATMSYQFHRQRVSPSHAWTMSLGISPCQFVPMFPISYFYELQILLLSLDPILHGVFIFEMKPLGLL